MWDSRAVRCSDLNREPIGHLVGKIPRGGGLCNISPSQMFEAPPAFENPSQYVTALRSRYY